ncbi:MAG TPA: fatty acid desaturase [Rhizomicrobium sp.]|jgi:omega-6 fatty acid desaturase (delta-12 desaturase)
MQVTEPATRAALRAAVAPFERPGLVLCAWQLATSMGLYLTTLALMYWSLGISYWLTLALAFVASALLVRVFIVQHDCGHGSFTGSQEVNDAIGALCGILTLAPYQHWRRQHSQHHANWNNLDRRESGADIYSACLTVEEYRARSPRARFFYRLWRHPLLAHLVFPPLVFLLLYRVPFDTPKDWTAERRSVWGTNLAIAACILAAGSALGFGAVALVQLPIVAITTVVGVWLFSVQHRFEDARWLRQPEWNFHAAALQGSSYLKLPRLLQWCSGNIGFHHIHHLAPRVPNYRLEACYRSNANLRAEEPLTLLTALGASSLTLWDEAGQKLVRFKDAPRKAWMP